MKKILFATLMSLSVSGFAMSANEIVQKAEQISYYKGKDGKAKVTMNISDGRSRQFVILRKNAGKNQKFFVYFKTPGDVRRMTFLIHKYTTKDDDRWMYLPENDLVKRIASGDKRTSFAGSNFFYEDVSGRNPKDDNHELIETTDNFYVIKSIPVKASQVEFVYYKTWIHKTTFIPTKVSYYNKAGKNYREYEAKKVEKIDGFQTVTEAVMRDLESGGETKLSYSKVKYNIGLKDNIFTERFLKNPPKKLLK